jgi:signal transduction histidine kinase
MKSAAHALTRPLLVAALSCVLIMWLAGTAFVTIRTQRLFHATMTAASVVVRDAVAGSPASEVRERMPALQRSLSRWQLIAAAFDRNGQFVAGDDRLSGDGLSVGQRVPPPNGRQIAVVSTLAGYVLIVPDPPSVTRMRVLLGLWLVVSLAIAGGVAYFMGNAWSRERDGLLRELATRAENETRLRAFLADAGHELRTPLAIAIGYAGILKRGGAADRELTERIFADISVEHERLQRLVERILQLARLDAVEADRDASCDAVRIAEEAIALVRPLDPERAIELHAKAGTFVAIGADDLRDALRNLLDNAIRYAPNGAIAVRIDAEDDVVIRVSDGGPGMDAYTAAHAFDRFFRGAERGSIPGSGLGLAIVHRIAERAHGRVVLNSAPDSGTTVELHLPRVSAALGKR